MSAPLDPKNLPYCIGIDDSSNDGGDLAAFRALIPNAMPHHCAATAVSNLLGCIDAKSGPANVCIVGHGASGDIILGGGKQYWRGGRYIGVDNFFEWKDEVRRFRGSVENITLLSCDSGREAPGLELLCLVLEASSASSVRARTGFTSKKDDGLIWFEEGSTWRTVTRPPGDPVSCVDVTPEPGNDNSVDLENFINQSESAIPESLQVIRSIELFDLQSMENAPKIVASGDRIRDLTRMIGFHAAFVMPGQPLAIPTARAVFRTEGNEQPVVASFLIYNNRIARDEAHPDRNYHLHPALTGLLVESRFVAPAKMQ